MNGDNVTFPAVLIISRPPTALTPEPFVLEDDKTLASLAEAAQRVELYHKWEVANRTTARYTYTLTPVDQVAETKARLLAELSPAPAAESAADAAQRRGAWAGAVGQAANLAKDHFDAAGNQAAYWRVDRAVDLVMRQNWQRLGDQADTWAMGSQNGPQTYLTNGHCTCPDWQRHGAGFWCKHRIARGIAKRAAELLAEGQATA